MTLASPRLPGVLRLSSVFSVLLACLAIPAVGRAQTAVTLEIADDVTIRGGGYGSVNYATSDTLEVKTSANASNTRRALLKFDTQNRVPAGAVINSAKLYVTLKWASDSTSRPIGAYRVSKSFVPGEATWLDSRDASPWSAAGGDLSGKYASTSVANAPGSTYAFDITSLVQRTVNGDFGSRYTRVALLDTGTTAESYKSFHSTRAANTAVRPRLVVSYGSSTAQPLASTTTGTTLKVMQWNAHETKGSDGRCDPLRIATTIAKFSPDVVSLNEIPYYHSTYVNDDVPARLEAYLEQKTGRAWYRKFINVYGGSWGYGNVILSRYPFTSSSTKLLSYKRGVVQVGVAVNGRTVNIFSTHVDYYNSSYRTLQTNQAKSWISGFAGPRIVMGDFNTNPGTNDYSIMSSAYADGWAAGKSAGIATAYNGTGATHGASRFDYVYYSKASSVALKGINVPDTRVNGVYPSDHDPVVATFTVN
jgi:endonuclease/exonuclease/phosphatase family metal-dependent hydrolase